MAEQMIHGFARGKALRSFAELLGLDDTINPPIEDLDDGRSWLQILGPYRPDGVSSYARESMTVRIPPHQAPR
jgi:hypothetical protein